MPTNSDYLLGQADPEIERLQIQAKVLWRFVWPLAY